VTIEKLETSGLGTVTQRPGCHGALVTQRLKIPTGLTECTLGSRHALGGPFETRPAPAPLPGNALCCEIPIRAGKISQLIDNGIDSHAAPPKGQGCASGNE
jgi:hypothetical protein